MSKSAIRTVFGPLAIVAMVVVAMALPALGGGRPLTAELSGENENPPTGHEATGTAVVTLNQGLGEVCADIETSGFAEDEVIAGHIHVGLPEENGPVVVDLQVTSPNHSICVEADPALIKDIRQNPSGYYVNLHSLEFPGGVIRGQLSK